MLPAEAAVFLQFDSVRGVFLILFSCIIPLFALGTGQRNNYPHAEHLLYCLMQPGIKLLIKSITP
jgi:hypothetical protein